MTAQIFVVCETCHEALPLEWEHACELATCCSVPAARLATLRTSLSEKILDRTTAIEARLHLTRHARRLFPGLLAELRRTRGLANDPIPSPQAWAALDSAARTMASMTTAPEAVHAALAAADVAIVMMGLALARELAAVIPEEAVAFSAEVLALCRDTRIEPQPIATRLCARARDVHAVLFAIPGDPNAWDALREVIDAMLKAGLGVSLGMHFRVLAANSIPVDRVGALLVQLVADRSRPVKERIQAREALQVLATDAAATRHNEPRPSPEGRAAARKADDILLAALSNPAEPDELKSAIRAALTSWMPDRIPSLQGSVVERVTVPSITALQPGQSIAGFDRNEIIALLRDTNADIGRVLAAIALTMPLARMAPEFLRELEVLLRARQADGRKFSERARNLTVAVEAHHAHREIWQQLKPAGRPDGTDLLSSLRKIAASQEAPGAGEHSRATDLVETFAGCLAPADIAAISAGLETDIADSRLSTWTRLHAYHALARLQGHGSSADRMLFAALADPGEDPALRREAHPLLANHLAQQVYELQDKGLLPRPEIPPVETIFHNLPLFERDTEGEWVLTPQAFQLASLIHPDDLIAALRELTNDPSRVCAAAALASLVAQRLPAFAGRIAEPLRNGINSTVEVNAIIAGRKYTFNLTRLCTEALRAMGQSISLQHP